MNTKTDKITSQNQEEQIFSARSFCFFIAEKYWKSVQERTDTKWKIRRYNGIIVPLSHDLENLANKISNDIIDMDPDYAGYELSLNYMKMLPKKFREEYGVFYTPINVVEEMLCAAAKNGIDLKTAKIIDTSSGGSAFLAPICRRMIREDLDGQHIINDIAERLTGFELDEFAAWLSQFLIDCEMAFIAPKAIRPSKIVINTDALTVPSSYFDHYDYVIGNPPYGKLGKKEFPIERYHDVVFGSANLYQLFYKLSFLLAKEGGCVQLITPTSFIGGLYFKRLRNYLNDHGTAMSFSFFQKRTDVFDGVQQELVITLFKKARVNKLTEIYSISCTPKEELTISQIGSVELRIRDTWVLPKSKEELDVSRFFQSCPNTLSQIGYKVQTGYVVPHRDRKKLSNRKRDLSHPIIWAEAIQEDGFNPGVSYLKGREKWYSSEGIGGLIREPAILIKRTSSKEQARRIHSVLVDQLYIESTGGFFAENHINVLTPLNDHPEISLSTLLKILQTKLIDRLFRCINGTVTVSSTELNLIPLPNTEALIDFKKNVADIADREEIEKAAHIAYEVE
ncbi:MAG: Eco57I restriction-modification methylase domain-containing protein [Thiomicrorhabdus sp.]|jgi:hypothetical protein|nr:Eco57I restriction-modification methylase domain-containing protein [Thiomicrorhabdus sp.]